MKGYTVYRIDSATGRKEAVGSMLERRRKEGRPGGNLLSILSEARLLFGQDGADGIEIAHGGPKDVPGGTAIALSRGVVTITSC